MPTHQISRPLTVLLLGWSCLFFACSGDPELSADTGVDTGFGDVDVEDVEDVEEIEDIESKDTDVADTTDSSEEIDTAPEPTAEYCEPCTSHDECIDDGALCFELADGLPSCGLHCDPEGDDCPDESSCLFVDDDIPQCVPNLLTCTDRCENTECPSGEYCNPVTGDCEIQPRICETGCNFDTDCGDPLQHRCISTGAPDGETMCTTHCDPTVTGEDGDLECPADFICATVDEEANLGVCFPIRRTCIDRCHDIECPAGQNCDPFTGDCIEPTAGACEDTCEIDAECGGQDDMCLNLGIGNGPHCWNHCVSDDGCPDGYECTTFLGLTTSLCLPPAQQCSQCYDADCFPDGVCEPTTGECMPHPEDCTIEGCEEDELCEPTTKRCVGLDRSCSGDSWAVDCDNVVTRCTSQRSGADGVCATICFDDTDCEGDRSCTTTEFGDLCLKPDLGGPISCGVLTEPNAPIGTPCGPGEGGCNGESECVITGGVPGFCSFDCDADADCPDGATCGVGPHGDPVCLPAQCRCASAPALPSAIDDGLLNALDEVEMTVCDVAISTDAISAIGAWEGPLFFDDSFSPLFTYPLGGIGRLRNHVDSLDEAAANPAQLLAQSAALLGLDVEAFKPTLEGPAPLVDALSDFADTAGSTLDTSAAEAALEDVPDEVQQLASHLVEAIDEAYQARADAFDQAGLDDALLQTLFDQTHRLFLPHADGQNALDIDDDDISAALESFPLAELAQAGVDLAYAVETAIADADLDPANLDGESFLAIIDTPAGAVVIGDGSDNIYDGSDNADLDQPIALLLDIGGDNEYRIPVAANQSVDHGIAIVVDLAGDDTYSYPKTGDALDGDRLLVSDDAGRKAPGGDPSEADGPVSLSETARQGAGRLGIGMLFNRGGANTYETLRIGQGAAVLGIGAVFDEGQGQTQFEAESFAQGAALKGVGLVSATGGDNTYRLWHAGQGFGTASGVGVLYDHQGNDHYTAVAGTEDDEDLLYLSPSDPGDANHSLAQGAGAAGDGIGAGFGVLRDAAGSDTYLAGSHAQGFGADRGIGLIADAAGDDSYDANNYAQGTGIDAGAGVLIDSAGDDEFTQSSSSPQRGQGAGDRLGWGAFIVEDGQNIFDYHVLGAGLGFDGGMGFAFFGGGPNEHDVIGGGYGFANLDVGDESPLVDALTVGVFVQTGGEEDSYTHPAEDIGGDNTSWRQDDEDDDRTVGIGVDQ